MNSITIDECPNLYLGIINFMKKNPVKLSLKELTNVFFSPDIYDEDKSKIKTEVIMLALGSLGLMKKTGHYHYVTWQITKKGIEF